MIELAEKRRYFIAELMYLFAVAICACTHFHSAILSGCPGRNKQPAAFSPCSSEGSYCFIALHPLIHTHFFDSFRSVPTYTQRKACTGKGSPPRAASTWLPVRESQRLKKVKKIALRPLQISLWNVQLLLWLLCERYKGRGKGGGGEIVSCTSYLADLSCPHCLARCGGHWEGRF